MLRYVCAPLQTAAFSFEPHMVSGEEPATTAQMRPSPPLWQSSSHQMMNYNVVDHYDGDVNFPGLEALRQDHRQLGDGDSWFIGRLPRG